MVVSLEQMKRGAADYIDQEFTAKLTGPQRWIIGALGGMYVNKLGDIVTSLKDNPAVAVLGVFPDGGGIDIDTVYAALRKQAEKTPVTFDAPILGSVRLTVEDVDKLYRSIVR